MLIHRVQNLIFPAQELEQSGRCPDILMVDSAQSCPDPLVFADDLNTYTSLFTTWSSIESSQQRMAAMASSQLRLPTSGRQQPRLVARATVEPQQQSRRTAFAVLTSGMPTHIRAGAPLISCGQ